MKKKFSTKWKGSKQPRKQRKYLANAPLHIRKNFVSVNLSKELRGKYGKRNLVVRKGDTVKIMRGKYKKKQGKVTEVKMKIGKIMIDGIQVTKKDGSKVNVPLRASNLQIIEVGGEDKKRIKKEEEKDHSSKRSQTEEKSKSQNKEIKTGKKQNAPKA